MTIKILKQGNLPPVKKSFYLAKCKNCETEFEYEYSDVYRVAIRYYGPVDCDEEDLIKCPFCHCGMSHSKNKRVVREMS